MADAPTAPFVMHGARAAIADGMPIPFAMLHAMVDSHHELPEVDEKNNLMVMERLAIPAVPPMAAGPATPGVPAVVQQ